MHKRLEITIALIALVGIAAFYVLSLISLWLVRPEFDFNSTPLNSWQDLKLLLSDIGLSYLRNTLWQASLSASVILLTGYLLAKSLFYLQARTRSWVLTITNASFSLPTIIVIFAFLAIAGSQGWLNQLLLAVDSNKQISIYGLTGIILANTYFNLGYTANALYNGLQKIPFEQIKLAQSCRFKLWQVFWYLERPYLKAQLLNLWLLMFLLCFNSFALVLFLGGPKYMNFEVGIYQALVTQADFTRASVLALMQMLFSLCLIALISLLKPETTQQKSLGVQELTSSSYIQGLWGLRQLKQVLSKSYALLACAFIALPLGSIFVAGWHTAVNLVANDSLTLTNSSATDAASSLASSLSYPWRELWSASKMSLIIALGATLACLLLSIFILRGLRWLGSYTAQWIHNLSLLSLVIPSMLLGAGYFLLLNVGLDVAVGKYGFITLIVIANATSAIVFSLNYLTPAYQQIQSYTRLAAIVNFSSWQSFWQYEFPLLKYSIGYAALNVFILSLGDYSIILFFISQEGISSITYLLAHQLNSYNQPQGSITAVILLSAILLLRFIAYSFLMRKQKQSQAWHLPHA